MMSSTLKASPEARQLWDHPHPPHLLQTGGGGGAVLLQGRASELDPSGRPEKQMVDLEQHFEGGQHQHEKYLQLPGEEKQQWVRLEIFF